MKTIKETVWDSVWVIEEGCEYLFKGWLFCFFEEFEEESIEEVHFGYLF